MPRLFAAAMVLTAAGLATVSLQPPNSPASQIEAQEPEARFESQLSQRLSRLANDQAGLARKYARAGAIGEAIRQFRWAIHMDPDCGAAWRGLGYNLRGGNWEPGNNLLKEPDEVDVSKLSEREKEAHEKRQAEIDEAVSKLSAEENRFAEKATSDLLALADRAIKAGEANLPVAQRAARYAAWYSPNSAEVGKARGFVERNGEWFHPEIAATIDMMQKNLADGSRGAVLEGDDPQAKALGWDPLWRTHLEETPWIVRTTRNQERPHRLMQVITASEAVANSLTGNQNPTRFRSGTFTYTEVGERAQFNNFVDKHDQGDDRRKENLKRLSGTGTTQPHGFIALSTQYSGGDDMCSHNVAATMLRNTRGFESMPWVTRGFGYLVTAQMLNTTSTRFYTFDRGGRTNVRGGGGEPEIRRARSGPARLRRLALEMVCFGEDPSFAHLSVTNVNDLTEAHVAKALSLFEMLTSESPELFKKWLLRDGAKANDDLEALIKLMEIDAATLQSRWKEWVLSRY